MKKLLMQFGRYSSQGFALVELLVAISIVLVIATLAIFAGRGGLDRANASRSLPSLRQSGIILLADAQETGGEFRYSNETNEGVPGWDLLPENIVRSNLGLNISSAGGMPDICEITHWKSQKLRPVVYQANCLGVNFTDVSDLGALWVEEEIHDPVEKTVKTLLCSSLTRPEKHTFLLDSFNSEEEEIFSIDETKGKLVGLRNAGRANAFFLDGSAGELGSGDLKTCGFTKVYDNTTTPPKAREL